MTKIFVYFDVYNCIYRYIQCAIAGKADGESKVHSRKQCQPGNCVSGGRVRHVTDCCFIVRDFLKSQGYSLNSQHPDNRTLRYELSDGMK